jgi:hypothetical protein
MDAERDRSIGVLRSCNERTKRSLDALSVSVWRRRESERGAAFCWAFWWERERRRRRRRRALKNASLSLHFPSPQTNTLPSRAAAAAAAASSERARTFH